MSDKKETPLRKASWSCHDISGGLDGLLEVVAKSPEAYWNGLALTTAGAVPVARVSDKQLLDSANEALAPGSVYELRLWSTTHANTSDSSEIRARELRWLNGLGAVDVQVSAVGQGDEECWCRLGEYLQHHPANDKEVDEAKVMSTVEVFRCKEMYGNTVFVDELFTGKWA